MDAVKGLKAGEVKALATVLQGSDTLADVNLYGQCRVTAVHERAAC